MATALEQLRYIDEQLAAAALPPDQAELVKLHRLTGLQLRDQRLQELGDAPQQGTAEFAEWEKCRKELEAEVELSLADTRLSVEGLEESWEKWLHIEKLKAVRDQLLQQTAAEGILGGELKASQSDDVTDPTAGNLQDAASWESLQIAPLQSPGAWEAQQLQQQQMQVHLQHGHDGSGLSDGRQEQAQDPQHVHMQHAWPMALPQDAQAHTQVMAQPPQPQTEPNPEGVSMKHCRRCNTHKPITQFYKSKANADGYDGRCKTCDAVQCAQRRKRKERIENPTVEWKSCRRCGTNKPATEFYRNKTNSDGLYNNCKACFSQDAQNRRDRLPPLEERTARNKECRRCKEMKPASEYYKNKHMIDGLYTHCKACYTEAANLRSQGRAPAETKRCRRCGTTKEASEFYVSKMTADGLQSYCKACYAVASAARRSRNNQEVRAQKEAEDYATQHHAMHEQLMQGQMVDPMQQVMGVPQLQAGLDPALQAAQLQQMGYDPSVMQTSLADHQALAHHGLDHHGLDHSGLDHHHHHHHHHPHHHLDPTQHHGLSHHLDHHQGLTHHHHLDPNAHAGAYGTGLEHHSLDTQAHDHLHDHQAYSHQHEHAVM